MNTPLSVAEYVKIIGDENRFAMLQLLRDKPLCVCEIFPALHISQNLASHHLKVLKEAGLVSSTREGTKIIYARENTLLKQYQTLLNNSIV